MRRNRVFRWDRDRAPSKMCGLTGYVGARQAAEILVDSLKRLEYRGYDSCGVAVLHGQDLFVAKQVGAIDPFRERILKEAPPGTVGIGHTRWATHGRADEPNAHPHLSCDGGIAVVHNGIIENADALREELERQGHRFTSATDSEVIPHLLEQALRDGGSVEQSFLRLREQLRGSYAIMAVRRGADEILLMRKGSPLVVGVGDGEFFPASDIPSFLPLTSRVVYLPEDDGFVAGPGGLRRLEIEGGRGIRSDRVAAPNPVNLSVQSVAKGNFEHFMIKEILEQTGALDRLIRAAPRFVEEVTPLLRHARQIILIGAGTSYHACLFGKHALSTVARVRSEAHAATEFEFYAPLVEPSAVVLALSQSGETADTLEAVRMARERGAVTVAITNVELSSLTRMAERVIPLYSGPELAVAATKSYTAQLAVLALLAQSLEAGTSGGTRPLWQAQDALYNLTSDAARRHTRGLATSLLTDKPVFLLGRGAHYVTALEAALKLKEVSGLKAEAFQGGEMKHGPLALVEEGTPIIHFYDEREAVRAEVAASELASRGARIFSVGPRALRMSENHIRVDDAGVGTAIAQIVPMQILAYELAKLRHLDPDHPRNLAKSVTVA